MNSEIKLNKEIKQANLNLKEFETFFVGVEFEFQGRTGSHDPDTEPEKVARMFGVKCGKTLGQGTKLINKTFSDGSKLEVAMNTDLYKEAPLVTQVYPDGSIQTEVVCRPIVISQAKQLEKVHSQLKAIGADFFAGGRGGCHLTFMTDPHKEFSEWNPLVIKNITQLVRRFYPTLIEMFPGKDKFTRKTYFRHLPTADEYATQNTHHYCAVSLRKESGKIWSFEIRLPDGNDNFQKIETQIRFYAALIRQAAIITKFGLITFEQETWEANQRYCRRYIESTHQVRETKDESVLLRILEPSLKHFSLNMDIENVPISPEIQEKAICMFVEGNNKKQIMKELGLSYQACEKIINEVI